jgi:hypothetical protein
MLDAHHFGPHRSPDQMIRRQKQDHKNFVGLNCFQRPMPLLLQCEEHSVVLALSF